MEKVEIGNCECDYVASGLELVIRLLYEVATGREVFTGSKTVEQLMMYIKQY
jgi:hypothetical protein